MLSPLTHDDPSAIAAYHLLARLGSGGMGTVYLARSPGGRTVALKTLHARLAADPASRTRFRLETDAARVIGDRHGAAVFDADPLGETPWLATEYVLGPPLDEAVALAGPLPEPTVRAVGAALAGALRQLHSSDVVHRDLKPSNILVTAHGPKLIDFGIARAAGDDRLTSTGTAAGTPAYMSPEQASGQEHTPAGDVFALAGVLLFAATGRAPFGTGAPADLLYRVRYADPDPEALAALPPSLRPLLTSCLAKDPAARPTTDALVAELHDGHGEFADHLPAPVLTAIARRATDVWHPLPARLPAPAEDPYARTAAASPAPSASRTARLSRPARLSRRGFLALGGGAVLAAGTGAGVWAWQREEPRPQPELPTAPPLGPAPASLWSSNMATPSEDERAFPMVVGDQVALVAGVGVVFNDVASGQTNGVCSVETTPWTAVSDGDAVLVVPRKTEAVHHDLVVHTADAQRYRLRQPGIKVSGLNANMAATQLLCAADGVLYLAGATGTRTAPGSHVLLAVDTRTGKELWRTAFGTPTKDDRRMVAAAAVRGNRLLTFEVDNEFGDTTRLAARDTRTGAVRWQKDLQLPHKAAASSLPCLDETHVYVGGADLSAYRLDDGTATWQQRIAGTMPFSAPALRDGTVYSVAEGGAYAVAADSGTKLWQERAAATDPALPTTDQCLAVGPGQLFYRSELGLTAVDLKSRRRSWVYRTDADHLVELRGKGRMFGVGQGFLIALPLK
ncbi:PQQ-binding-like beta-propeller repeat protein [Streptomyces sp. NPDC101160]|uniref:serine/threonine-protein kinase n=1 Tax=Streptomyces sp. NPDC101160 TaxID=3366118 RepID=UPI0037FF7FD7